MILACVPFLHLTPDAVFAFCEFDMMTDDLCYGCVSPDSAAETLPTTDEVMTTEADLQPVMTCIMYLKHFYYLSMGLVRAMYSTFLIFLSSRRLRGITSGNFFRVSQWEYVLRVAHIPKLLPTDFQYSSPFLLAPTITRTCRSARTARPGTVILVLHSEFKRFPDIHCHQVMPGSSSLQTLHPT